MKLEVTRDVISDLWPVCQSGEASADSRAVVDAFLREDGAFAATLKASDALPRVLPHLRLSPDAERRLLDDARARAQTRLLVIGGTVVLLALVVLAGLGAAVFAFAHRF
jgi:hypothetical protein